LPTGKKARGDILALLPGMYTFSLSSFRSLSHTTRSVLSFSLETHSTAHTLALVVPDDDDDDERRTLENFILYFFFIIESSLRVRK
jgi:hypothetical protein